MTEKTAKLCWKNWLSRLGGVVLVVCLLYSTHTGVRAESARVTWVVPPDSVPVLDPTSVKIAGMSVHAQAVHIPRPVAEVAAFIGQQYPALSRTVMADTQIQFVGRIQAQLAVITLQADGPRQSTATLTQVSEADLAYGARVSSMVSPLDDTVAPIWMPRLAALVMHTEHLDDGRGRVTQQIWRLPPHPGTTWNEIQESLRRAGWDLQESTAVSSQWKRRSQRLALSLTRVNAGAGVYLQLTDGAPS